MQECDVISISNSDYIYEYEIKISKADFKKDFEKQKHKNILNEKFISGKKDELNFILPNYFNYVVPNGLISEEDVPEYAGLIYYNDDLTFEIIKKPKMLHKIKANNEFIRQIGHNLCCKLIFNKII